MPFSGSGLRMPTGLPLPCATLPLDADLGLTAFVAVRTPRLEVTCSDPRVFDSDASSLAPTCTSGSTANREPMADEARAFSPEEESS